MISMKPRTGLFLFSNIRPPCHSTLFPYTTLFRSDPRSIWAKLLWIVVAMVGARSSRSEEHTSELQSPYDLVCRLLLEKKKIILILAEMIILTIMQIALEEPKDRMSSPFLY